MALLKPSFTNTSLDASAAAAEASLGDYARQVQVTGNAVVAQIKTAPPPPQVAEKIDPAIGAPIACASLRLVVRDCSATCADLFR